ncbi:hypothetical protein FGO68_gene7559 [Halteria grandinella]|uniref:Uncharacterized protein n=1 Tax=Halteria grandinella TaxID=5974 RepID=A0A8J8NC39_HALGN|nr:hypothetical protein FGO68_gene7559 [Halteria grandinella]
MESAGTPGDFVFTLDNKHSFNVTSQEDLFSTIFQIEYTKQAQTETVLACSKDCFQAWRQEDISRPEKDCLQSCFSRSNQLYDLFYQGSVSLNQQLQSQSRMRGPRNAPQQ